MEAEIETLNTTLKTLKKSQTKKKPAKKTTSSKRTKPVNTPAKPAPVSATRATATTPPLPADKTDDKYAGFIADVHRYDHEADTAIITKIVNHLGIALRSRDGQFVACSDETERQTVRDSWLVKKLGVTGDTSELDAKVMAICETMQKDRMKNRVTFYYLLAKNEGKLAAL